MAGLGFTKECMFSSRHGLTVTVPGAAAAWVDTVENFGSGKLSLREILKPAIRLAEEGFPVQEVTAHSWKSSESLFQAPSNQHGRDMLLNGRAPRHGEIMRMPFLANTFKELASQGKSGFYCGRVARAVSEAVQQHGGLISVEDLQAHQTTFDEPISTSYRGLRVWEMPPSGQGLTALMALNILEGFDLQALRPNSAEYLHLVIEALRLSFADTLWYNADPSHVTVPVQELLSKDYAAKRRDVIDPDRAIADVLKGSPFTSSDTVYFCVADAEGNACSFINSNYMGFGTAIVPEGCGFTLQNRGCGFSLDPAHPNVMAPNKRPYHTIIPSLVTSDTTGELLSVFGVMGGFMQPQGHVQVLLNQLEFGMNPQQALDQPRICIGDGGSINSAVLLEKGIADDDVQVLRTMGHPVSSIVAGYRRSIMGRGQVITRGAWWARPSGGADVCSDSAVYWAGSDPRADGCVAAY